MQRQPPDRFATAVMALLLVIGLYFPSSLGEVISIPLYFIEAVALFALLVILLLRRRGVLSTPAVINAAAVSVILFLSTLFSPLTEFAYGGYIPILLFSLLLCVSVREIGLTVTARTLFDICNGVNIALAVLLLLRVPTVTQFFLNHYAWGYEELLPYMIDEGKPVLMFGSHSVAGFFFYLLFYVTFQTFVLLHSKLNLLYSLCYLALLASLSSFTSVVFCTVAVVQIVAHFQWHKSFLAGLIASALILAGVFVALPYLDSLRDLQLDLVAVTQRQDNGLLGRYSSSGGLTGNLEFIASHPFRPIGLGFSHDLWYTDSGPVEYILKGSFPLLFAVYSGAFVFFYKNLRNKRRAIFLFLVFLAFELGYPNLQYIRTQFFLPFLMVYMNGLEHWNSQAGLRHA
jgi:hypothetical protein